MYGVLRSFVVLEKLVRSTEIITKEHLMPYVVKIQGAISENVHKNDHKQGDSHGVGNHNVKH